MTRPLLALLFIAASIGTANAEWPGDAFSCRAYLSDLYWHQWAREHCRNYPWRKWRARQVAVSGGDALCQALIEVTGDQAQSEAAAYDNAVTAWKGRVRFRYGERYASFDNARDARKVCAPSSVADSGRDKALSQLYRCELGGRPCRAQPQQVETDD